MSNGFKILIEKMQGDWDFLESFFENPEKALTNFNLESHEKTAILSRNIEALNGMGLNEELAVGALSTTHSSTCTPSTQVG